jgi:hypothetical protein
VSVFLTKAFIRFAKKAEVADDGFAVAAAEVAAGNFDADLGGHVYKQRVARRGRGKSGGYRTIILFKSGEHSFFVHGFAKNEKANVTIKELKTLKALAEVLLKLGADDIEAALLAGELVKVDDGSEAKSA